MALANKRITNVMQNLQNYLELNLTIYYITLGVFNWFCFRVLHKIRWQA